MSVSAIWRIMGEMEHSRWTEIDLTTLREAASDN